MARRRTVCPWPTPSTRSWRRSATACRSDPVRPMTTDGDGLQLERLWAPHRMAYVTTSADGDDCPFCRIPTERDGESLVLRRGTTVYAVLNLHPYNPGHLMVVP